jgi:hypothetical protein
MVGGSLLVLSWFSPVSSTAKTGRHDIAEILLKVALNTKNQINQIINVYCVKEGFALFQNGSNMLSLLQCHLTRRT